MCCRAWRARAMFIKNVRRYEPVPGKNELGINIADPLLSKGIKQCALHVYLGRKWIMIVNKYQDIRRLHQ